MTNISKKPEILLITTDARLRETVRRYRPPDVGLRCLSPADVARGGSSAATELWLDLDSASNLELPTGSRRVYFHSCNSFLPKELPEGLFIRKPCTETVAQVLWSSVEHGRTVGPIPDTPIQTSNLPHWIMEFHELGLRELCRKCVSRLAARLGYADVSLYLHDHEQGLLTLAETTHARPIDLMIPMADNDSHLMVTVARSGRLMKTANAGREWQTRSLRHPADRNRYRSGECLIVPLVSGGRLWGVLNFSHSEHTDVTETDLPLEALFAFIGRSLRFARAYDRARTEARIDALTGLYNQRWILETLSKEIRRTQRFDTPLALIMADLDGLKAVNDRHGHPAGDNLLRHVANRITSALRQFDSAARVGGDEFVMLLPATNLEGAQQVARRIMEAIRGEATIHNGLPLSIQASLGVAQWEKEWDAIQLIEAADKALYLAKHQGRDQLVCWTKETLSTVTFTSNSGRTIWPSPTTSLPVHPPVTPTSKVLATPEPSPAGHA